MRTQQLAMAMQKIILSDPELRSYHLSQKAKHQFSASSYLVDRREERIKAGHRKAVETRRLNRLRLADKAAIETTRIEPTQERVILRGDFKNEFWLVNLSGETKYTTQIPAQKNLTRSEILQHLHDADILRDTVVEARGRRWMLSGKAVEAVVEGGTRVLIRAAEVIHPFPQSVRQGGTLALANHILPYEFLSINEIN